MDRDIKDRIGDRLATAELTSNGDSVSGGKHAALRAGLILNANAGDLDRLVCRQPLRGQGCAGPFKHVSTVLRDDGVRGPRSSDLTTVQKQHPITQGAHGFHRMRDEEDGCSTAAKFTDCVEAFALECHVSYSQHFV